MFGLFKKQEAATPDQMNTLYELAKDHYKLTEDTFTVLLDFLPQPTERYEMGKKAMAPNPPVDPWEHFETSTTVVSHQSGCVNTIKDLNTCLKTGQSLEKERCLLDIEFITRSSKEIGNIKKKWEAK